MGSEESLSFYSVAAQFSQHDQREETGGGPVGKSGGQKRELDMGCEEAK